MSILTFPFPYPGSSSKAAPSAPLGSIPTNEFVFDDDTSAVQVLTMGDADWGSPSRELFGVLARVTIGDESVSGDKYIWHQYVQYSSSSTLSWHLRLASNGVLVFYIYSEGTNGNAYTVPDLVVDGVETLIYCTYVYGTGFVRESKMYLGTGDDTPTEVASATSDPPYEGNDMVGFGGHTSAVSGWNGTIHQPLFFSGAIPLVSQIGTATNPVDLSAFAANIHSAPDADNLPTDRKLDAAWTNNNSVTVQARS